MTGLTFKWWAVGLCVVSSIACGRTTPAPAPEDELATVATTRWTQKAELFAEHPVLVVGEPARFAIHLTDLATFRPLTTGTVRVHLEGAGSATFSADGPSRPGIFGVTVTPTAAGKYTLRIDVTGALDDAFDLGSVDVFATTEAARRFVGEEPTEERIAFLKEQQWALDFGTAVADRRALKPSLLVPGEIRPRAGGEIVVSSPVAGRIVSATSGATGTMVRAGEVLARVLPHTSQPTDRPALELAVSDAQAQLELARADRARAERLTAAGAVPARRLSEAAVAERSALASLETATKRLGLLDANRDGQGAAATDASFLVRSPAEGVIVQAAGTPGISVAPGDILFRIVAIDLVHVTAFLPEADLAQAGAVSTGELVVAGQSAPVTLGPPVSRSRVLDPASRTLPLIFALARPDRSLAVGQRVSVRLFTGVGTERVAVPVSAIVDDAGRPVVFVQREGESFARRPVTLGPRDGAFIGVDGISAGERVVVRGAPLVRLAALSTSVPSHGHVH